MSGLAVFGLKYPSLLELDRRRNEVIVRHNLKALYGVEQVPCDTRLRECLDKIEPEQLCPAFIHLHQQVQRQKGLEAYRYVGMYYLVSIDATGQFSSTKIRCKHCCEKYRKSGTEYYHQLLAAVLVHPDKREVLPFFLEPITHQDRQTKNDCELNAAKRLLPALRKAFPQRPFIVVEDSLYANGPHLELVRSLGLHSILHVKPGDHKHLFDEFERRLRAGELMEHQYRDDQGVLGGWRYGIDFPLNASHPEIRVNMFDF